MGKHAPRQLASTRGRDRWVRFIKSYLEFAIQLAQVNPAGSEQDGFGPSVRRSQLPLWSRAAEIYFYYFNSIIIVCCLLQSNYDRAKATNSTTGETCANNTTWLARQEREAELARATELVEITGNPFYDAGGIHNVAGILVVNAAVDCYLETRILDFFLGPFQVGVARLFLDPRLERELMLRNELGPLIETFIRSAANYLDASKHKLRLALAHLEPARPPKFVESVQRRLRELEFYRKQNIRTLRDLVASGELDPLNRRPEWTRRLALVYGALLLWFSLAGNMFGLSLLLWLPNTDLLNIKPHYGWRENLFTLQALVYCSLHVQWLIFPVLLTAVNTLDLIGHVIALKRMVTSLTGDITGKQQNRSETLTDHPRTGQLARVLIQYKLFKQKLLDAQSLIGFVAANVLVAMLLGPALARVYATNMSASVRHVWAFFCLFIIAAMDMFLLPACYLHARCLELYRAMSHLLAHLDAAASHCNQADQTSGKIYIDEHTLWLLRRELHQPELATQQFATNAHLARLTYANLMGVHFYCGLWLVPMLMRDASGLDSGTGNLLAFL